MSFLKTGRLGNGLRWLLQVDQAVPPRSNEEIAAEVARNYRWNFTVNVLEGAAFWFGFSFASARTILPLFISKLTPSPLAVGLLAVLAQSSWFLPQLFVARATEQLPRKKPVVVNIGFFLERLPTWLWVVAAVMASRSPELALVIFMVSYAWHGLGTGVVAPAWQELIAHCFPVNRRGRLMGFMFFIGAGMGAIGSVVSAWLLEAFSFPVNFAYAFAVSAAAITISWFFLVLTRESVHPVTVPPQSGRQYWSGLPRILRRDRNFRHFLVARLLMALGGMGAGFVTVAAVARWQVPDSMVAVFTAAMLVGQTVGNLALGWLADRFGHKLSLEFSALTSFLAFAVAWLAPAPGWYYVAFALMGVSSGAVIVSGILVVLEFSAPDRRPTYVGLANTSVGLVSTAAPLFGAWLANHSYGWLFALSAGISLLSVVAMHWWVREPRWADAHVVEPRLGGEEIQA